MAILSLVGAALLLFKVPKRTATMLLSGALILWAGKEFCAFLFLNTLHFHWITVSFSFETSFVALWVPGLILGFNSEAFKSRRTRAFCCVSAAFAVVFSVMILVNGEMFFYTAPADTHILYLARWGVIQAAYLLFPNIIVMARLESAFRQGNRQERWVIKYPMLGACVISGVLVWQAGLRLSYHAIDLTNIPLYSAIEIIGLGLFLFYVIRHKLFDMQIFISRYVVYNSVAFAAIGVYLFGLGILGVGVRYLGFSVPFLVKWLFIFTTGLMLVIVLLSASVRKRVKHFINTHFFENKYDYRYEWIKLSGLLSSATSASDAISNLRSIIAESMFVNNVSIWLGEDNTGYRLQNPKTKSGLTLSGDDPFITYLRGHSYFLASQSGDGRDDDDESAEVLETAKPFLERFHIDLAAPLKCGDEFFGFVALDEETYSEQLNQDDVDLLTALASQTSVFLMTIKLGVDLSEAREVALFNKMGAFVLHDLKNASAMLSLLNQSAPKHIANPEFQQDLLEAIDNAYGRIQKVIKRLQFDSSEEDITQAPISLSKEVELFCVSLQGQWEGIDILWDCDKEIYIHGSPGWIRNILENIFLNAKEAMNGTGGIKVALRKAAGKALLEIADTGPGIDESFSEERMFKPFQTTKKQGLGVGLWQVKHYVDIMKGNIKVLKGHDAGAVFRFSFPLVEK